MMASYTAVRLYGPGHVVAYNYVADFHDGIDIETYGNPDGSHAIDGPHYPPREFWDRRPVAIDFYNNYMTNFHDNAFEIDGSMHNVRVMRNMMINSASHPMCNQPAIGGPIYWIRNIVYHAPGGSTRLTNGSAGVLFYNNTILTETSAGRSANVHWRNNLMLGRESRARDLQRQHQHQLQLVGLQRLPAERRRSDSFQWNSPRSDVPADYSGLIAGGGRGGRAPNSTLERADFTTLAEYSAGDPSGSAQRRRRLRRLRECAETRRERSQEGAAVYKAEDFDFGLKPGSAAVDRGVVLPNVTDGFAGQAPDRALEFGHTPPHYGPRP